MTTNLHDIVVWGATGYTGRLVAGYLRRNAPADLRWALGGRDRDKLERVRTEIGADVPVIVADANDPASLSALVRSCRVVASTVGPFFRYGTPLVQACAEHGTDYCDITGETHWIRANIDSFHARAAETGARIVHCCGFDSIPSDLGVWMLHDFLRGRGRRLARVAFRVARVRGGFSGGTIASLLDLLELASRDRDLRRLLVHPYTLNPADERQGPDRRDLTRARFDPDTGRWIAPFIMAAINTRIVRRTNALSGYAYGRDFRYDEAVLCAGRIQAYLMSGSIGAMLLGGSLSPTRALMRRMLRSPGQGPSEKERTEGGFEVRLYGWSDGADPIALRGKVRGEQDPGYGETSKMLSESALCLALDEIPRRGGILTPACCMGSPLLARLRRAGMTFEVAPAAAQARRT